MPFIIEEKEWNAIIAKHNPSLLQSFEWGTLQGRLGRRVRRFANDRFAASIVEYPLPLGMSYWYIPHGPILLQADLISGQPFASFEEDLLAAASGEGRGKRPIFLKVEPLIKEEATHEIGLKKSGFRRAEDTQPSETIILDLTKDDDELLEKMEHDTRYAIRAAERRGVSIHVLRTKEEKDDGFEKFWELFVETNARHGLRAYQKSYYRGVLDLDGTCHTELFFARLDEAVIGAAIIGYFCDSAYYLYAASRKGFGKYNAPSLILWHAMRRAKEEGCQTFDLWGISADGSKKAWSGITAYKKSFGGPIVIRVGTWDRPWSRVWYRVYLFMKLLTRALKKIRNVL